jgi:hypothetical protein
MFDRTKLEKRLMRSITMILSLLLIGTALAQTPTPAPSTACDTWTERVCCSRPAGKRSVNCEGADACCLSPPPVKAAEKKSAGGFLGLFSRGKK